MPRLETLIIDHQPLVRRGIRSILEEQPDLVVVGETGDGPEGIRLAGTLAPDVVLLNLDLRGADAVEIARNLKHWHPQVGVIGLTANEHDDELFNALRAGISAYVRNDIEAGALVALIRSVGRGEYQINDSVLKRPRVASQVLDQFRTLTQGAEEPNTVFVPLTRREMEILDCIARGNRNKDIARELGISEQTVKNHVTSILRKLAVNDRTQAVIYAVQPGLISLEPDPGQRPSRQFATGER